MRRIALVLAILFAGLMTSSASSFERMDAPVRWSRSVGLLLNSYAEDAHSVTIVPPEDEDGDWTVIFVYSDDSSAQWI